MRINYEYNPILRPKTLRWSEPFNGSYRAEDTGLCNRLHHWEIGYELAKRTGFRFALLVEEAFWHEWPYLRLPYTEVVKNLPGEDHNLHMLKFRTVYDVAKEKVSLAKPLTKEMIDQFIKNKEVDLSKHDHWYPDFGYEYIGKFNDSNIRGIQRVRPISSELDNLIRNHTFDCVGIHIRRGHGVQKTRIDIEKLPKDVQNMIELSDLDPDYKFYSDDLYIKYIDAVLHVRPDQKFYISCDLLKEQYWYIIDRYPKGTIRTKYDILDQALAICDGHYPLDYLKSQAVRNIVDLFGLSYCKFLLKSPTSSWSDFAQAYRNIPHAKVTTPTPKAVQKTLKALE